MSDKNEVPFIQSGSQPSNDVDILNYRHVMGWNEAIDAAANAASMVFGGPSHKVSENTDTYRIQDHAVERCVAAIRALKIDASH